MCRWHYLAELKRELQNSKVYKKTDEPVASVLKRHQTVNELFKLGHENRFPYLYGLVKLHKPSPKMRWIAGVSATSESPIATKAPQTTTKASASLTRLHKETSNILKAIMRTLLDKDLTHRQKTGIRRYFIVESASEVAFDIKQNYANLTKKKPVTYDFSTMYTALPHEKLKCEVKKAVKEAFSYATSLSAKLRFALPDTNLTTFVTRPKIRPSRSSYRLRSLGTANEDTRLICYSEDQITSMVDTLVDNTFLFIDGAR